MIPSICSNQSEAKALRMVNDKRDPIHKMKKT